MFNSKIWEFMFIFWNQKFVAKKNIFSKTIFFEQSILSEVGLVKIWKGTDQYNLSNETFKHGRKMIKNVSFLARLRWDRSYVTFLKNWYGPCQLQELTL